MQTRMKGLMAHTRWLTPAATVLSLLGCPNQELAPLEPCTVSGVNIDAAQDGVDKVDMVFMVDNSGSMAEEQAKLVGKLTRLVQVLTTGDKEAGKMPMNPENYDGRTFAPPKSLHIGITTSDLGSPPTGITTNASQACVGQGANGTLLFSGVTASMDQFNNKMPPTVVKPGQPACASVTLPPRYLGFGEGGTFPNVAADQNQLNTALTQFGCVATTGTKGCGIEQQLEATFKVVAPPTVTNFVGPDISGHGAGDFLRPDSVLALVLVTDEDDCSVSPAGGIMFEKNGTPKVNVRCQLAAKVNPNDPALMPVQRYVEGLLALRGAYKERLIFAGIIGLPQAGVDYNNFDQLLAHPQMTVDLSPGKDDDLNSVCGSDEGPGAGGRAYPGRRFVEVAKGIAAGGGGVVLRSICDEDYAPALDLVIDKIAQALGGACLPRPLKTDAEGKVTCQVIEILREGENAQAACSRPGRKPTDDRQFEQGGNVSTRKACEVTQLLAKPDGTDPGGAGWYYDTKSDALQKACPGGQRVVFSNAGEQQPGSTARVECFQPQPRVVRGLARGRAAINAPCTEAAGECAMASIDAVGERLLCEPSSKSCQIACGTSADCPEGWLCEGNPTKFCQNPTCPVTGIESM